MRTLIRIVALTLIFVAGAWLSTLAWLNPDLTDRGIAFAFPRQAIACAAMLAASVAGTVYLGCTER